jgi:hypothetical protein
MFIFSDGQKTEIVAKNEQFVEQTPVDTSSISIKPQNVAVVKSYSIRDHLDSILFDRSDHRKKDVRLDFWYQNYPTALTTMDSLVKQNKYQEVISMYESDSIQAIIWLHDKCIVQNLISPENIGLSKELAQKFIENAPDHYVTLVDILIDMFEKEAESNGRFYSMGTYMDIFDDDYLCYFDDIYVSCYFLSQRVTGKVNNVVNFVAVKSSKQGLDYANVLYIQAKMYRDNKEKAIEILREAKLVYEQSDMENSEEWQKCTDLLTELIEKAQMPESSLLRRLIQLERKHIETKLQDDIVFVESIPFTQDDWAIVKKGYEKWRKDEIAKGNYQEKCPDISNQDDEDYSDRLSMDALPEIPAEFKRYFEVRYGSGHIDTLMADINFDGKPDIIFKIDPEYCMGGTSYYMPLPTTIYLSFLSKESEYQIDNRRIISKAVEKISQFNYEVGDEHIYPKGIFVSSIEKKNGIIIISGNSITAEHVENVDISDYDPNCCPSYRFEYSFDYILDKSGNGYAYIDGRYVNYRKKTKKRISIYY